MGWRYWGGFNSDGAYCVYCGRDRRAKLPNQPASKQQSHQTPPPQGRPAAIPQSPYQQTPATQRRRTPVTSAQNAPTIPQPQPSGPVVSPKPTPPEPPALFPPPTVAQLQTLKQAPLPN